MTCDETRLVTNIAALQALTERPALVRILGYYTAGDRGAGDFYWVPGSTAPVNGGTVFACVWGPPGRYIRLSTSGGLTAYMFGARGDGGTPDDDAIENGLAAAAALGEPLYLRGGTFCVTRTIAFPVDGQLIGDGLSRTAIFRNTDYGWTFTCGSDTVAVNAMRISNIWFRHGTSYTAGDTALDHKATSGGWFEIFGSQQALFEHCRFWRLPYGLYFKGGTLPTLRDLSFNGTWDHTLPACQEGIASIVFEKHSAFGHPQLAEIDGCMLAGSVSASRAVTINGIALTMSELIGPKYGIIIRSIEGMAIKGGYFGGHNVASIAHLNETGGIVANIRLSIVWLDACRGESLQFLPADWNYPTVDFAASKCTSNGQLTGQRVLAAYRNGSSPSLISFSIDIQARAHFATPLYFEGAVGGTVDGVLTWYNGLNLDASNALYCAAAWVTGISANIVFKQNVVGGGGNAFSPPGGPGNFCYRGIVIDAACGANGCYQTGTVNAGVTNSGFLLAWLEAGLPPAAAYQGEVRPVIDSTSTTRGAIVAGGGANTVLVRSDGANWLIV